MALFALDSALDKDAPRLEVIPEAERTQRASTTNYLFVWGGYLRREESLQYPLLKKESY